MSFIYGGDTGLSYEDIQRKRKVADALVARQAANTPRNVGEGLHAIGNALLSRKLDKDAAAADKRNREAFSSKWDSITGSLMGNEPSFGVFDSSTAGPIGTPFVRTEEQEIGDDAMAALGKTDAMSTEGKVLSGLVQRGLPEHVAKAFVMNFRDESGLNPGINEKSPIVPGSRGGFGLAQWTGPRRRQLEAFAQQRGTDVSDMDTQLDFLMTELQGSESGAAKAILGAQDTPQAAAAIVNKFLRPAEEHRARREAEYLNGAPVDAVRTASNGGMNPAIVAQLAEVANSPYASPAQKAIVSQLINQQMQANDPLRQLQLEKAQLELDTMRNPQAGFSILSPEQEAEMGLDPAGSYQRGADGKISRIGGGDTKITLKNEGTIPQGYRAVRDENGNLVSYEAVPGGPEDTSAHDAAKQEQTETATNIVLDEIGIAKELIAGESLTSPATGLTGKIASKIDSTRAGALKNRLETIKANIGFDKLQRMREASPTGGALGAVSEFENRLLQSVFGSLEQAQNAEDIIYNLERLEAIYDRVINQGIPDDEARQLYREIELGEKPENPSVEYNFTEMPIEEITEVPVESLTDAQKQAMSKRLQELGF